MLNLLRRLEKLINRISQRYPASEEGQAVVIVALFLFFVFLAFAALSVDGTILYLRRRQLQNAADSAALTAAIKLSQNKTETEAYQTAMDNIAANSGQVEWYSTNATPNPPATNVGSGLGLTMGIEITNSCDVRVALRWSDIGTYFAQFVGQKFLEVGANARAGCNRSGGLQPIAMKRFGDERHTYVSPPPPNTNNPHTVYCEDCNTRRSLAAGPPNEQGNSKGFDFFRPKASDQDVITEWPGWPNGLGLYQSPSPHTTNGNPGREFFFLGAEAGPNQGNVSFSGLINLDIRRPVGSPVVQYYNGMTPSTAPNTLKDLGEYYIRRGYCCDIPNPGDLVAMFSGASASFSPQALQETYPPGDVIAIIIYNGTVFKTPSMLMTGEVQNQKATYPMTTTVTSEVLTYTIHLEAIDDFESSPQGLTLDVEGLDDFASYGFSNDSPILGGGIPERDVTLYITPTLTTTTVGTTTTTHVVTGTRMFYVSAIDNKFSGTGVRRYWAGIASIGDTVFDGFGVPYTRTLPAVTGTPNSTTNNYPFMIVAHGDQATYEVDLNLWEGASDQNVQVDFIGTLPTGFSWVGSPPWNANNVRSNPPPQSTVNIKMKVDSTATANTTYDLPFLVTAADGMTQTLKTYVFVEQASSTGINDFVEILGYAAVEIDGYYNNRNLIDPYDSNPANTVRGHFVSEIMSDPSDLTSGLRPRLIPWDAP